MCVNMVPRWDSRCVLTWYQDGTAGVCLHGTKMEQQVCVNMVPRWDSRCVFTLISQNLHLMYRFYGKLKKHNSLYLSSLRNALPRFCADSMYIHVLH